MSAADFVPSRTASVSPAARVDRLRAASLGCRGCELWEPATQTVFSTGGADAPVVLVGEQPGDQEDRAGKPFVGPAGQLLARAVDEAGIPRGACYLTNAVKHFRFTQAGPGKRRIHQTPELSHITACRSWLEAELEVLTPRVVVVLGATAGKSLLGPGFRVTSARGRLVVRSSGPDGEPTSWWLPTTHPSAVLRSDDRETAFAALVSDLRVAATTLA